MLNATAVSMCGMLGVDSGEAFSPETILSFEESGEDERTMWYKILPNAIRPGKIGDIQIGWAHPPYRPARIPVEAFARTRVLVLETVPDLKQNGSAILAVKPPINDHAFTIIEHDSPRKIYAEARKALTEINSLKWNHDNLREYDKVIELVNKVISGSPEAALAAKSQALIIECYNRQAEYRKRDRAFDMYVKMIEEDQGVDSAVQEIVEAADRHFDVGEYWDAKLYYAKLLRMYPSHARGAYAQYGMGQCYNRMGSPEKAMVEYRTVLHRYDSKDEWIRKAQLKLADVLNKERRFSEAVDILRDVLRRFPQSAEAPDITYQLGYYYYLKGDHHEAERRFGEFLSRYPHGSHADLAKSFLRRIKKESYTLGNKTYTTKG